jgi:hypothetical protein
MTRIGPAVLKRLQQLARYVLAAVFLLSAIAKLLSPAQFREFVSQQIALGSNAILMISYGTVGLEVGIALLLLYRPFRFLGGVVSGGVLLAFTVALMFSMQTGSSTNCGCFGGLEGDMSIEVSILRNIALLCLSVFTTYSPTHAVEDHNG